MMLEFVRQLGRGLVEWNVLTPEELKLIERTEMEESPHGFGEKDGPHER